MIFQSIFNDNRDILKKTAGQNNLKIKLMVIGITVIGTFILSGCQETSMVRRTSLPNLSPDTEKIYTLAEFPSDDGVYENETTQNNGTGSVYLVGTESYAEKLMSIYENGEKHILNANTSRLGDEVNSCVPILMIAF